MRDRPVPSDMQDTPPVPCDFKPGDAVTFTNDYGVSFPAHVRGFTPTDEFYGRFVYLDYDCWWFPAHPQSLTPRPA